LVALGEDAYFGLSIRELTLIEGKLPIEKAEDFPHFRAFPSYQPYATIEGEGEVYYSGDLVNPWHRPEALSDSQLAIRVSKPREVIGYLHVPRPGSNSVRLKFKVRPERSTPNAKQQFQTIKQQHYASLRARDIPGAAWFRHQERESLRAHGITSGNAANDFEFMGGGRSGHFDVVDTFELFSGGRAISENLQLDRDLRMNGTNRSMVDTASLKGITIREMDWKPLINAATPKLDVLAAYVPHDQHAIFFPSFKAMIQALDEADAGGTPLLQWLEPRSEEALTRARYQKQLCLELDEMSRILGPTVISSVAMTGSDPYLRTGSDLAILFEAKSAAILKATFIARQTAAKQKTPSAKSLDGEIEGVSYTAVGTEDRTISSYVATFNDVVLVSNSLFQLRELILVAKRKKTALAVQDEYIFFRQRYQKSHPTESAFLVLTDATIRRWCGPKWRIANSRRTRAAAAMTALQAAHFDGLVKGTATPTILGGELTPEGDELRITKTGVASRTYGTLDFLTPIAELPLDQVTRSEADSYQRWCDTYQQNWQQFFDPIAIRVSIDGRQLAAEVTVMPLIANTDYAEFMSLTQGARIAPGSGDPHAGALLHFAMAINAQSKLVKSVGNWAGTMNSGLRANPLGWLGETVAIYADQSVFWDDLAKAANAEKFFEKNYHRLPFALHCEVKNALGLATFLTTLRGFVEQTAPGITSWQTAEHNGKPYVKISGSRSSPRDPLANTTICYASTPNSFILTLDELLLKRALDRQHARTNAEIAGDSPWLGTNLCIKADQQILRALQGLMAESITAQQQRLSWNNLPILNEWKRLYPDRDPVKLHEQFWQTRLLCSGGGAYVWNQKWQTMESTVYGHPAEPRQGPERAGPLARFRAVDLGLSFENQGLSAKAVLERDVKSSTADHKKVALATP